MVTPATHSKEEIFGAENFKSTICLINEKKTLDEEKKICEAQNMKSMEITDEAFEKAFREKAREQIGFGTLF